MPIASEIKKVTVSVPEDRFESILHLPQNPIGIIIVLFDEVSGRKKRKNNLATQILIKTGFAVITAELNDRSSKNSTSVIDKIIRWVDNSDLNTMPLGIFSIGDGFTGVLEYAAKNSGKVKSLAAASNNLKFPTNHKQNLQTLLLVGALDEESQEYISSHDSDRSQYVEVKIIPNASRLFTELGKFGEAINVASKWFVKQFQNQSVSGISSAC